MTEPVLDGRLYITTKELTTADGTVLAVVGGRCDKVPPSALAKWLVPQGIAVLAPAEPAPAASTAAEKGSD